MDAYDFCLHMKITMLTSQDFTGNQDLVDNLDCEDFEGMSILIKCLIDSAVYGTLYSVHIQNCLGFDRTLQNEIKHNDMKNVCNMESYLLTYCMSKRS